MMTRNQKANWKAFCSEPLDLVENYQQALAENFKGWDIHHRREIQQDKIVSRQQLIDQDLYYSRPAEELVFMRHGEHMRLHNLSRSYPPLSLEHRQKIAESLSGENNPRAMLGKHHSEETRQKLSQSLKGKNTWIKGKHWWNNGVSCKFSRECPGEGWKRGRITASRTSL